LLSVWSNSEDLYTTAGTVPAAGDATELTTNATMESDSEWVARGTPTTEERSSDQNHTPAGTYSWKVITDGADEGIAPNTGFQVVAGKLYEVSVWIYNSSAARDFDLDLTSGASGFSTSIKTQEISQGSWEEINLVTECTTAGDANPRVWAVDAGTTFYVDDFSLHEVTPGIVSATTAACDGWTKETAADIWREHSNPETTTKYGSFYSLKILSSGNPNMEIYTPGLNGYSDPTYLNKLRGRVVTFGAWVKTDAASQVKLNMYEDGSNFSDLNGSSAWEWLEITRTIGNSPAVLTFGIYVTSGKTAYISQPQLSFGSSIGEGNFCAPVGEVVWLEGYARFYANKSLAAAEVINLESATDGKIPKGSFAGQVSIQGVNATANKTIGFTKNVGSVHGPTLISPAAAVRDFKIGWVDFDTGTSIYAVPSDGTWTTIYGDILAVQVSP
jgi:hypothetical protein